jgi:hypothetical protein
LIRNTAKDKQSKINSTFEERKKAEKTQKCKHMLVKLEVVFVMNGFLCPDNGGGPGQRQRGEAQNTELKQKTS